MIDNAAVGTRIRDARQTRGLTQEQLAELSGLSATFISNIERGLQTASLDTFVPICNALSISSDILLQDVVDAAVIAQTNELSELLQGQPKDVQQLVIRMVRAAVER